MELNRSQHILKISAAVALALLVSAPVIADSDSFELGVRRILLRRHPDDGVGRVGQLERYVERSGETREALEQVLIGFVEEGSSGREGSSHDRILSNFSIEVLGALRSRSAIPVLRNVAMSRNDATRRRAVRALANMGGPETIAFAREVEADGSSYSRLDRFALYETLIRNLRSDPVPEWESSQDELERFLLGAIERETSHANVVLIDEGLVVTSPAYRTSYEREEVLEVVLGSPVERHKDYARRELVELRRVPVASRTHVDVGQ